MPQRNMSACAERIYIKGIYILPAYLDDRDLSVSYWNAFFFCFMYSKLLSNFASLEPLRTYPILPWGQKKLSIFSVGKINFP